MATAKKPVKKVVSRKATPASKPVVKKSTGKASVRVGSGTKKKQSLLSRLSRVQWIVVAVFILAFAGLGTYLIKSSSALSVSNYGCTTYPTLRYGSSGDCVRKLQAVLKLRWGYSLTVDGQFGSITQSKVKAFQTNQRISSDGVVGPITWGKLNQNVTYTKTVPSGSGGTGYVQPINPDKVSPDPHRCVGYYKHPVYGTYRQHNGIDFGAATGTPIYAVKSGKVIASAYSSSAGNYVKIDHGNGITSNSMHMSSRSVGTGASVYRGQVIGKVGSTGASTDPHLHFELRGGVHVSYGWFDVISKSGYSPNCDSGSQTKNQ